MLARKSEYLIVSLFILLIKLHYLGVRGNVVTDLLKLINQITYFDPASIITTKFGYFQKVKTLCGTLERLKG
jgi:hypothetical protein